METWSEDCVAPQTRDLEDVRADGRLDVPTAKAISANASETTMAWLRMEARLGRLGLGHIDFSLSNLKER